MKTTFIILLIVSLAGCNSTSADAQNYWEGLIPFTVDYNTMNLGIFSSFASRGSSMGEVHLPEASGLAISKVNANGIWTHNDSGHSNNIYLLNKQTGATMAVYRIDGTVNEDWEDIEVGPGPTEGVSYVYVSDTGDNDLNRSDYRVYRFPEPRYDSSQQGQTIEYSQPVDTLRLAYPSDEAYHNVEALLLDPINKDLYLISKMGLNSKVFVAPYPQSTSAVNQLQLVGTFPFRLATAADASPDGLEIAIKNYDYIFYWQNPCRLNFAEVLGEIPERVPYNPVEAQGEAIAFGTDGYYTTSEEKDNVTPKLYFYARTATRTLKECTQQMR